MPALTLDNELGALVVSRDNARSCIPYAEIEQFSICDRVSSDSDGDKNHTYYIYVQCKDMSKWFLTDAHTYDIANEMLNKVKSHCDLSIPFTGSDIIAAKPALQQAHPPDKFMVTWSNKIKARPIRLFTLVVAITAFVGAFAKGIPGPAASAGFAVALMVGIVLAAILTRYISPAAARDFHYAPTFNFPDNRLTHSLTLLQAM